MSCEGKGRQQQFEIACANCVFHVYCELWKPKVGQTLQVKQEIRDHHNPFAISLGTEIPGKLTDFDIVRYYSLRNKSLLSLLLKLWR